MNHKRHYDLLIERARDRPLSGYSENHHVIPRCVGGSNAPENLVCLTAEEHYVAHQLLVFMYPGNHKILWAASNMTGKNRLMQRPNNKMYSWIRKRLAEQSRKRNTGYKHTDECRARMSASHLGVKLGPRSAETKAKMSAAAKGRAKSPEHCAAISRAHTGRVHGPHTAESRKRMSVAQKLACKTRDHSWMADQEYKEARRAQMKQVWALRRNGEIPMPNHYKLEA